MSAASTQSSKRPRVVILGAGFAGLNAAKTFKDKPVDVVLADRTNYHKFQPLLYQVATAGLEPGEIAHTTREIFRKVPNISFRLGTVKSVDAYANRLLLRSGEPLHYEYLILAAGAVTNYFGIEGVKEHSFPLKNVPDAIDLRSHILRLFERVDRERDGAPEGALNFVVVGGGPTGVEMAGALVELFKVMRRDYRHVDTLDARVFLVEMLPDLLPPYSERSQKYTRRVLEKRGVEVLTERTVARVTKGAVHLKSGETIPTRTLIWAAGVRGHPVGESLDVPQESGFRVAVESDLSVPGHPNVFVAGDLSGSKNDAGDLWPQVAQVAIQQGRHAARQVLRRLEDEPPTAFHYRDLGQLATIGRHAAVAELPGGIKIKGFAAWLSWAFLHIWKLVGFRNRMNVFVNWIYNYFTYDRNARLILEVIPISESIPEEVEDVAARVKREMETQSEEKHST